MNHDNLVQMYNLLVKGGIMKSVKEQLSTYKSVHLNKHNIKSHFLGIPIIIWSVAVMLTFIQFDFDLSNETIKIPLTLIIASVILLYYFILSLSLAVFSILLFGPVIYLSLALTEHEYKAYIAIFAFVIGWIIQFIGHHYEKAKPAFIDDLNQLAIGPLFLVAEVYFAFGFNKKLATEVEQLAIKKRKTFEVAKGE